MYTASCDFHIIVQTKYNKYISTQKNIGSCFKLLVMVVGLFPKKKCIFFYKTMDLGMNSWSVGFLMKFYCMALENGPNFVRKIH